MTRKIAAMLFILSLALIIQTAAAAPEVTSFFGELHNYHGQVITAHCVPFGPSVEAVVTTFPSGIIAYMLQIECPDPANSLVYFYADGRYVTAFPYSDDAGYRVNLWLPYLVYLPVIR